MSYRITKSWLFHTFIFSLLLFFCFSIETAHAKVKLKVGVYNNKPTIFADDNGIAQGLFIDVLEEIAKREEWQLEYVKGHFSDVFKLLEKGDIDILPALAFTEKREMIFDYTSETIMANWAELYIPNGRKLTSLLELEGKKVAVKQGDVHFSALQQMTKNFNISCRFLETDEYQTVFEMLHADYVQVGVVNRLYGHRSKSDYNIKETPVIFNPIEMRFGAPKGQKQEILATIDSYMYQFSTDENSVYYQSINKWFVVEPKAATPKWLLYLFGAGTGVTLFFLSASLLFRYQVKKRTEELTGANNLLEAQINERLKAEESLRKYARIVETSSDAVALIGRDNYHILVNRAYVSLAGVTSTTLQNITVEELLGKEFFERELQAAVRRCLQGNIVTTQIGPDPRNNSKSIWNVTLTPYYTNSNNVTGYVMDMRNVTDQISLQNKLKNAQKMEAIGLLAGSVAHDLNNILSGVVSYPDMLLVNRAADDPMTKPLQTIKKSGERAATIVQDLLTLARRGGGNMEPLNLNNLIEEFSASPEYTEIMSWTKGIKVHLTLSDELLCIEGSATHLSKALMNLVANGVEAMQNGGDLIITTQNHYINMDHKGYEIVPAGEYILLALSDTGVGITQEEMNHIFEPFYSSKKLGRSGTGLGMAVVWGVVKDHDGYIDIESQPGAGTTFKLYFPITRNDIREAKNFEIEAFRGNGQKILVVDDLKEQRILAERILLMLNYQVVTAASGEEALKLCRETLFDLILMDMIMPGGMSGLTTYEKICDISPNQKAVIASGFSDSKSVKKAQQLGARSYISKPYTVQSLAQAVYNELNSRQ